MRSAIFAFVTILSSSLVTAGTFDARSERYALAVSTEEQAFFVRVTDLQTNALLFSEHAPATAEATVITRDIGEVHFTIRLHRMAQIMTASLDAEQGDMLTDSIHASWLLAPRRAHIRAEGAMHVGGEVKAPLLVHKVEPAFTDEARRNRVSGIVVIEALVVKTGQVADAVVVKPLPFGLSESAIE